MVAYTRIIYCFMYRLYLKLIWPVFCVASRGFLGPKLHCLVNNVGTNVRKKTVDFTPEDIDKVISTNLLSAVGLCQAAHPDLKV